MEAEAALLEATRAGDLLDVWPTGRHLDDLAHHATWSRERYVRAEFLADLCTSPEVTHRGVRAIGLKVTGELDLNYAPIPHPLLLNGCVFEGPVKLEGSDCLELEFGQSLLPALRADRLKVAGRLVLANDCLVTGGVRLQGAQIGAGLHAAGVFLPASTPCCR